MINRNMFRLSRVDFTTAVLGLLSMMGASSVAVAITPRFDVTSTQVAELMVQQDFPTDGIVIKLGASITASNSNPHLVIQAASMISEREARLRIRCETAAECLPFFAYATWPSSISHVTLRQGFNTKKSTQPNSSVLARTSFRPGAPAILQLEGGPIHIKLQVICVEGGSPGEKIHVTTPDHKRSYVAEIISPSILKGTL